MRLTTQLSLPVTKAAPLWPFLPAAVIAVGLAWTATLQPAEIGFRLLPVRLGVVALTLCSAFVFDDPAGRLTNPTPHPLRMGRLVRAVCCYLIVFVTLGLMLVVAARGLDLVWTIPEASTPTLASFPAGRLVLETATSVAFALAAAAVVSHRERDQPGRIVSMIVLGAVVVSWMIPEFSRPWADPTDQRWTTSANWWWVAFALFLTIAVAYSWEARYRSRPFKSRRRRPNDVARGRKAAAP